MSNMCVPSKNIFRKTSCRPEKSEPRNYKAKIFYFYNFNFHQYNQLGLATNHFTRNLKLALKCCVYTNLFAKRFRLKKETLK